MVGEEAHGIANTRAGFVRLHPPTFGADTGPRARSRSPQCCRCPGDWDRTAHRRPWRDRASFRFRDRYTPRNIGTRDARGPPESGRPPGRFSEGTRPVQAMPLSASPTLPHFFLNSTIQRLWLNSGGLGSMGFVGRCDRPALRGPTRDLSRSWASSGLNHMSENPTSVHRQQQLYWTQMIELKVAASYIRHYRDYLGKWVTGLGTLRAIASSGSIAAWALWKEYAFVWGTIIAASQVVDALKDVFPSRKNIRLQANTQ